MLFLPSNDIYARHEFLRPLLMFNAPADIELVGTTTGSYQSAVAKPKETQTSNLWFPKTQLCPFSYLEGVSHVITAVWPVVYAPPSKKKVESYHVCCIRDTPSNTIFVTRRCCLPVAPGDNSRPSGIGNGHDVDVGRPTLPQEQCRG